MVVVVGGRIGEEVRGRLEPVQRYSSILSVFGVFDTEGPAQNTINTIHEHITPKPNLSVPAL